MALKQPRRPLRGDAGPRVRAAWALAAALLAGWPAIAAAISVLDAQTLLLSPGKKARLYGIVTPKSALCECAAECLLAERARDYLRKIMLQAQGDIRVQAFGQDADGVSRVKLFVNSRDVSMLLIQNGFAQLAIEGSTPAWCPR